jgi:arylsulfatase A-like enzyme
MNRPNILLLYTDQQRWDALAAAGNEQIHTPNLDALAAGGFFTDHAFVNHPVCMPSRQSMLSGQYGESIGCVCNGIEMDPSVPCLHNVLAPAGYHTANIGKLHFKNHAHRDHREPHPTYGFDTLIHSDEPGCYDDAYIKWVAEHDPAAVDACRCDTPPAYDFGPARHVHPRGARTPYLFEGPEELTHTAFVADETCRFLRRHREERFLCIAGFYAPHPPLNPPERFVDLYDPVELPLPHRPDGVDGGLDDQTWRKVKQYYYALVSHVDDQVGRILRTLEELGLRERTLVVFTSDHGENLGDHATTGKCNAHDSAARVPLIVSWPGRIGAGQASSAIVEAVDIAPTLLDFAGVQTPPWFQGRSLRALCEGKVGEHRTDAYISRKIPFGEHICYKALRTREHLLIESTDPSTSELYDLQRDPHQLVNVIDEPAQAETLATLRARLLRRWFDVESPYPLRTGKY